MGNLTELLSKIQPAVYEETKTTEPDLRNSGNYKFVENVTKINIKRSVKTIVNRSYILEQMVERGEIAIIGAMHNLDTGVVDFLDDTWVSCKKDIKSQVGDSDKPAAKAVVSK